MDGILILSPSGELGPHGVITGLSMDLFVLVKEKVKTLGLGWQ